MNSETRPRVVIAYDGSPSAKTAVRVAAGLFEGAQAFVATAPRDVSVHLGLAGSAGMVTVPDLLDALVAEGQRHAGETAQEAVELALSHGLQAEVATVAPFPPVAAGLLDTARQLGADVLVCGTRGRGVFARALLGSTSSRLLHDTDVPLLVVPDGGGGSDGRVVVAYDGSDTAKHAIEVVGRILAGRSTVLVHAWEPGFNENLVARAFAGGTLDDSLARIADVQRALRDDALKTIEEGVAAARSAGLEAVGDAVPSNGSAWRAVAATAGTHGAALIVVGTRGLGAARSVLLGSVSSGLVQNAELPILVVPDEPAASAVEPHTEAHADGE
jgi:nucleotide-binding universal stress UspA family protein